MSKIGLVVVGVIVGIAASIIFELESKAKALWAFLTSLPAEAYWSGAIGLFVGALVVALVWALTNQRRPSPA